MRLFAETLVMRDSHIFQLVGGSESPASVVVFLTYADREVKAECSHPDTSLAGVMSIINAVNKFLELSTEPSPEFMASA